MAPERFVYFIGYGRSGHSLVGALLDAHPECCVSHELDAFGRIRDGVGREGLFEEIRNNSIRQARRGRTWHRDGQTQYHYAVEGQYQGRTMEPRVIGDKKGGRTTRHLAASPDLVEKAQDLLEVELCPILILRHPLDNIASMVTADGVLDSAIQAYAESTEWLVEVLGFVTPFVLTHEAFVHRPRRWLRALAKHLGVAERPSWARACASIVSDKVSRSRDRFEWSPEQLDEVRRIVGTAPFLQRYAIS